MTRLIVFFILCSAVLTATTFVSEKGDYSIKFPNSWRIEKGFMNTDVMGISPLEDSEDQFRDNVIVVSVDMQTPVTLDEYYDAGFDGVKEQLLSFDFINSGSTQVGGVPAKWMLYRHELEGTKAKVKQYLFIKGKRAYVITCTADPGAYKDFEIEFEKIVDSFKFD